VRVRRPHSMYIACRDTIDQCIAWFMTTMFCVTSQRNIIETDCYIRPNRRPTDLVLITLRCETYTLRYAVVLCSHGTMVTHCDGFWDIVETTIDALILPQTEDTLTNRQTNRAYRGQCIGYVSYRETKRIGSSKYVCHQITSDNMNRYRQWIVELCIIAI